MESCLFCKIIKGEIPSVKVYENNDVVAFMDIIPNIVGHVLVVPKTHAENIFDITVDSLEKVVAAGKMLAVKMKENLGAAGVHLANNNGKHANQIVDHFHLHVIPRYEGDGLQMYGNRDDKKPSVEELQAVAKKIQA